MRGVVLLVIAGGCGRLGFESHSTSSDGDVPRDAVHIIDVGTAVDMGPHPEAGTCVGSGHDEDGDGVDDNCDLCPWVADPLQPDTDGDFLGDACDPDPSPEAIVLFDPFVADTAAWHYNNAHSYVADSLRIGAITDYTGQYLTTGVGRDHLVIGGHVDATAIGAGQIVLGVGPASGNATYFCELYQDAGGLILSLTYTLDGVGYANETIVPLTGSLSGQDYILELDRRPPNAICTATWKGARHVASGAIPGGVTEEIYYLAQNQLQVDLRYFARVAYP